MGTGRCRLAPPGVDDASTTATLADQLKATLAAVDAANRPMVVGHSAACTLAWMIAGQRPDAIDQVVLVGGFPASDGASSAHIGYRPAGPEKARIMTATSLCRRR